MYYKSALPLVFVILLSGCGGSNNKTSNAEEKPQLPKEGSTPPTESPKDVVDLKNAELLKTYYTYNFSTPFDDEYEPQSDHLLVSSFKHDINDGYLHISLNEDVASDTSLKQYVFGFSNSIIEQVTSATVYETFVSESNIYVSDYTSNQNKSLKTEKIIKNELGKVSSSPNTLFANDILTEKTLVWFDLSDKAMTEKTNLGQLHMINDPLTRDVFHFKAEDVDKVLDDEPSYAKYASRVHQLTQLQKDHKFPKGAKCFVFYDIKHNKPFIKFNETLASDKKVLNELIYSSKANEGNLKGIPFSFNQPIEVSPSYFSSTGGIIYHSRIFEAVLASNWNLNDFIKNKKTFIDSFTSNDGISKGEIKIMDYYHDNHSQGCHGYNEIAAKALNEIIKQAEK